MNVDDVLGMFPTLQARVGTLENRTVRVLTARLDTLEERIRHTHTAHGAT